MKYPLKYPNMRAELVEYIDALVDNSSQKESQKKTGGSIYGDMDHVVHFLYDDTCLAENPSKALGWFIKNEEEIEAINKLIASFELVFEKYGTKSEDEAYLKTKEWNCVVENAKKFKDILDKNVDKTWIEIEKTLKHNLPARVACPVCGNGLRIYDQESPRSAVTRVMECSVCGASNAIKLPR